MVAPNFSLRLRPLFPDVRGITEPMSAFGPLSGHSEASHSDRLYLHKADGAISTVITANVLGGYSELWVQVSCMGFRMHGC